MAKGNFIDGKTICDTCGEEISGSGYHNGGAMVNEQFCSKKCQVKFNELKHDVSSLQKLEAEESNQSYVGESKHTCDNCGKKFDSKPKKKYRFSNVFQRLPLHIITLFIIPIFFNKTYCSKDCRNSA